MGFVPSQERRTRLAAKAATFKDEERDAKIRALREVCEFLSNIQPNDLGPSRRAFYNLHGNTRDALYRNHRAIHNLMLGVGSAVDTLTLERESSGAIINLDMFQRQHDFLH